MKTLYLDCGMGAAGDMLTAALIELVPDPDDFISRVNSAGIPDVEFKKERTEKCGITGTHISVMVHGQEENSEIYEHEHEHDHEHIHENEHEHVHEHEDEH